MKPRKVFLQLFPPYFFIALSGLVVLIIITSFTFSNFYFNETKTHLTEKAHLIESKISQLLIDGDFQALSAKVSEYSQLSNNRVTVILPSGMVIADSSFDAKNMKNHLNREEIKTALKGYLGEASRYSPTLGENFIYIAIPLKSDDKIIGVLRNAVTVSKLEQSLQSLVGNTFIWSFFLLIFLSYLIYLQAKKISSPLELMKSEVENLSVEDVSSGSKLGDSSILEISSLFNSFKKMQENLSIQFSKITEQKNEQLAVFASMMEGVITITPDMKVYHFNKAALKLFDFANPEHARGSNLSDFVKSDEITSLALKLLNEGGSFTEEVKLFKNKILDVHGTVLESGDISKKGVVLVFNDITKVRELETHRTEFVANVSHELKTPLTAIQGYLETLQGDVLEDKDMVAKFIKILNRHSSRLKTIVEDLLALSSIERGAESIQMKKELFSLQDIARNVSFLANEKALKKNITIQIKGEELLCYVNVPLMEQALLNLLANAISYSEDGGEVVISYSKNTEFNKIEINVTDFGVGIAKEHHERLFERFYSVDKARSRELGGSGLGLSIVKHIALSHEGDVKVTSIPNNGSTFTIILPVS